jgi:CheY-like chemotaxis protein
MTRTNEADPAPDAAAPKVLTAPAPPVPTGPAPARGSRPAPRAGRTPASTTPAPRVLVVDADRALFGLIQEWLSAEGCVVLAQCGAAPEEAEPFDLVIVDVPYPRDCGVDSISRLSKRHPMTPILALSSTFFARIECCGPVARALGVACVLPTPVSRQALIDAVRRVLPAAAPDAWVNPES